jgi:hypothetical protein
MRKRNTRMTVTGDSYKGNNLELFTGDHVDKKVSFGSTE